MEALELAVTACIHLIITEPTGQHPVGLGSAVFIKYKERYFICTAEHVARYKNLPVSIITGVVKDRQTQLYEYGTFSYLERKTLKETTVEELERVLESENDGEALDIAFRETPLLENIIQPARRFELDGLGELNIEMQGKSIIIADHDFEIDKDELFCFFGRINADFSNGILDFKEMLYYGLTFHGVDEEYIAFDLGSPIRDHDRFRGCSGAPIFDSKGRLMALLTHGDEDEHSSIIYGFRFDKLKQYIEITYFHEINNQVDK